MAGLKNKLKQADGFLSLLSVQPVTDCLHKVTAGKRGKLAPFETLKVKGTGFHVFPLKHCTLQSQVYLKTQLLDTAVISSEGQRGILWEELLSKVICSLNGDWTAA